MLCDLHADGLDAVVIQDWIFSDVDAACAMCRASAHACRHCDCIPAPPSDTTKHAPIKHPSPL